MRSPAARILDSVAEDDAALRRQAVERGQRLALKSQLAVGVVLQNGEVELLGQFQEPPPTLQREIDARGVVEVGDSVEELGRRAGAAQRAQLFFQRVDAHALFVEGHHLDACLQLAQRPQPAHERRRLDDGHVAGVDERHRHHGQAVVGAIDDEHFVGGDIDAFPALEFIGERLAQPDEPGRVAIHERHRPLVAEQHLGDDLHEFFTW